MDLLQIKSEYEVRLKALNDELIDFIEEKSINSEYGDIDDVDREKLPNCDLEWNDAVDERYYNILQNSAWITKRIIELLDSMLSAQDDKKEVQRIIRDSHSIIYEVNRKTAESDGVIQHEYAFQNSCDEILDVLNQLNMTSGI